MKKYIISGLLIITFVSFIIFERFSGSNNIVVLDPNASQASTNSADTTSDQSVASNTPPPTQTPTQTSQPTSAPTPTPKTSGQYKDGTYTGPGTDAFFGTIQVQAVIQNGKLADVKFLQYPNDRGESIQVNNRAMPILKSEAIKAQSSKVSIVSGATQTSQAFQESLASALSQAKNS